MIRLFRVFVPVGTLALLLSEILLVAGSFVLAVYSVIPVYPADYLLYYGGGWNLLVILTSILIGLYLSDLYSEIYVQSRIVLFEQLCRIMGAAFLVQGMLSYLYHGVRMPIRV